VQQLGPLAQQGKALEDQAAGQAARPSRQAGRLMATTMTCVNQLRDVWASSEMGRQWPVSPEGVQHPERRLPAWVV